MSHLQKVVRCCPKQRSDESIAVRPIANALSVCIMKNSAKGVWWNKREILSTSHF